MCERNNDMCIEEHAIVAVGILSTISKYTHSFPATPIAISRTLDDTKHADTARGSLVCSICWPRSTSPTCNRVGDGLLFLVRGQPMPELMLHCGRHDTLDGSFEKLHS